MQTIRTLIVDDEPLARDGIRLHLEDHQDIEVIGECGSGEEAVRRIEADAPDLVFLDIQMPGVDGFGVVEAIGADEKLPAVVFVTAYDQFALRAFEAHALDYLLKPFERERFDKALDRVRIQLRGQANGHDDRLRGLVASLVGRERFLERMVARTGGKILILRVEDVDWIEAAANYVRVHIGPRQYLVRETMTNLETRLDPEKFLRIHRSIIVRKDRVKELEPLFQGDYSVILVDGTRLTSSRGYREKIQSFLQGVV